jgi:hypothetical protein
MDVKFVFNGLTAIIVDYKSYDEPTIDKWLVERGCLRQGMVITFCNEQAKLMFTLRWM